MDIILTKEALAAAREWSTRSGAHLAEPVIVGLIEAALPHLTERAAERCDVTPGDVVGSYCACGHVAGFHRKLAGGTYVCDPCIAADARGLDGQWLATQLEQLGEQLGKLQALVVERRTDTPGNIEREEKAFHRGVAIGRAEGEGTVLDGQLVESGPTDYEVWRDALKLAVGYANEAAESELLDVAKWFRGRLLAGPPEPSVPDCLHCGADSSMDHFEGCPKAQDPADEPLLGYQVVNPNTGEVTHGLTFAEYEAHPFKGATYPRTFPGVNPDGTGTGEYSGRAGG